MPAWIETATNVLITITMLVGLFGLIIPIFPGNVIMWGAVLVFGLLHGFKVGGVIIFVIISVLTVVAMLSDNVLMGAKAREKGAAWVSIALALGAAVLFTLIFPPLGGIIAAPLTLFAAEYARHRDSGKAWEVLRGLLAGWGWAFLLRFGIGVLVMLLWAAWALWL